MNLSLQQVAQVTGGHLPEGSGTLRISGVSTDSRSLQPGELFVPLRGERYDGHDYLLQAVEQGAVACLSEEVVAGLSVPIIRVGNTLKALGDLGGAVRQGFQGPVVGITGSAGKTSTKEMLASILEQQGPGLKTAGNFNNLIGVPLTLFRLEEDDQWMVLELGTSALGEIERLTEIAAPIVGVITNVAQAHLETLQTLEGVARAKGELFAGLESGAAIINADDPYVRALPVANHVRRLKFGLAPEADIRAENIVPVVEGIRFFLEIDGTRWPVILRTPGRHQVMNALAAAAAAHALDVPPSQIVEGLESYRPTAGRMMVRSLPGEGVLLDDSYNANPLSMAAALVALDDLTTGGQRIAVLGDMLELGPEAEELHRALGATAVPSVDHLVLMGAFADQIALGARDAGMPEEAIHKVPDHEKAAEAVLGLYQPGNRVLLKGSRGMRLEKVGELVLNALTPSGKGGC